jgi:hypothetical protein
MPPPSSRSWRRARRSSSLTNGRIIVDSTDFNRILLYHQLLEEHRNEWMGISRTPCEGGRRMMVDVFFCPPWSCQLPVPSWKLEAGTW